MIFEQLRAKHPTFTYSGWSVEGEKIIFNFFVDDGLEFHPTVEFKNAKDLDPNFIFHLGLIEIISYWKATCSPKVVIKAGYLNDEQIAWWKDLLINGLGEFFYLNKIDFTGSDLVDIVIDNRAPTFQVQAQTLQGRDLILVGGGKDSAVSLEVFKNSGKEFNCLQLNPTQASVDVVRTAGVTQPIVIKRTIDPLLLELNSQGYLNGHTPFSAYLAFLGVICAHTFSYKNVIVSNESSASEGNIEYLGRMVNHQYSKSFEFENLFREYCQKYLSKQINYFSFLRPLNELQIAKIFAKLDKYHPVFRSCNKGSKKNVWCGNCPKCLFAYIILYPFLGDRVKEIFAKDLLSDETLIPIAKQLIRKDEEAKPFECVGMAEESRAAICLCIAKYQEKTLPVVLQELEEELSCDLDKIEQELKTHWSENNLESEYEKLLRSYL